MKYFSAKKNYAATFLTRVFTCAQIFAPIGPSATEISGGGGGVSNCPPPPPPVKTWSEKAQLK